MSVEMIPAGYLPHPAKCLSCGDTSRNCLYFGMKVERYGAILLCVSCMSYAGRQFGRELDLAPLEDYTVAVELTEELRGQVGQVPKALEALRVALAAAERQFDNDLRSDGFVLASVEVPERAEPTARRGRGKARSAAGDGATAADGPAAAPDRPAVDKGPDVLPGDFSLDREFTDLAFDFG